MARRYRWAAAYALAAFGGPLAGAWLAITVAHVRVADSTWLGLVALFALCGFTSANTIITPTRRDRST